MPSTDPLPSLTFEHRRSEVAAFWIVGTTILWLVLWWTAAAMGSRAPWAWAVTGALFALLPGAFWRPWFEAGVWAWNGSVRHVAAALRMYVLTVCYYVLFAAIGRSGSSLELVLRPSDRSGWVARSRDTLRRDSDSSLPADPLGWQQGLYAFARTPGNRWGLCLLPLVFLLTLLRDERQATAIPGSTYTLY